MKLRDGWKAHGKQWNYKENHMGFSVETVIQFTQNGKTRYEAHFRKDGCCGFANSSLDLWDYKRFDNRDEAFVFCEEMYNKRICKESEKQGEKI